MRLKDKVTLVTGGASGIGAAICKVFAEEGATVVVTDINEELGQQIVSSITSDGGNAVFIQQDVADEVRWAEVGSQVEADFGRLDVLVNNAGIALIGTVESDDLETWRRTQAVNLDGVFLGTQAAIRVMKNNGGGSIINISSIEGIIGEPLASAYNAAKGGVRIFSKSAALHCADQGYGIRINSLHPGFVETPMLEGAAADMSAQQAEAFMGRTVATIPLGRMAKARELATATLFLASDDSSYVTGSELVVDGGYTAR